MKRPGPKTTFLLLTLATLLLAGGAVLAFGDSPKPIHVMDSEELALANRIAAFSRADLQERGISTAELAVASERGDDPLATLRLVRHPENASTLNATFEFQGGIRTIVVHCTQSRIVITDRGTVREARSLGPDGCLRLESLDDRLDIAPYWRQGVLALPMSVPDVRIKHLPDGAEVTFKVAKSTRYHVGFDDQRRIVHIELDGPEIHTVAAFTYGPLAAQEQPPQPESREAALAACRWSNPAPGNWTAHCMDQGSPIGWMQVELLDAQGAVLTRSELIDGATLGSAEVHLVDSGDRRLGEGDVLTLTNVTAGATPRLWDDWAQKPAASNAAPGPSLTLVASALLATLAIARRRDFSFD